MKIVIVYKQGGDFTREYVQRIKDAILPSGFKFECLTDDPVLFEAEEFCRPLEFDYPGYWSKMEMFKPSVAKEDIFYLDLDTVILDDIDDFLQEVAESDIGPIMLSDFYRPERLASGVMFIPKKYTKIIWNEWKGRDPFNIMQGYRGDQDFIGEILWKVAMRFDLEFPNIICSYKAHIIKKFPRGVRPLHVDIEHSKIVCFHGNPRPHDIGWKV